MLLLLVVWASVEWCIAPWQSTCLLICCLLYLFSHAVWLCIWRFVSFDFIDWVWCAIFRTLVRHTLISIQWWFHFHFTFLSSESDFSYQANKKTGPNQPPNNEQQRRRRQQKMDRVHDIKANEIVRHNIIQLFDILVGKYRRAHAKSHLNRRNASVIVVAVAIAVVCDFVAKRKTHLEYNPGTFSFCILLLLFSPLSSFVWFIRWLLIRRTSFDNAHLIPLFVIDFNGNLWICWSQNLLCRCRQRRRRITLYCIRQANLIETMKDWNWEKRRMNAENGKQEMSKRRKWKQKMSRQKKKVSK